MYSDRFSSALNWCVLEYQNDFRKSTGVPAIHHALGVCDLVIGAGGDEDTAIAALFHDFAEDKGGEEILLKIKNNYGERVERIVRDCSDVIASDYSLKSSWVDRKVNHINHIYGLESDSRLVLTADTIHNGRDHIRGFRALGSDWWANFRANVYSDREITNDICAISTLWYLEYKTLALLSHTQWCNCEIRDIINFGGDLVLDLVEIVQVLGDCMSDEQWNNFCSACGYMDRTYKFL